MVSSVHRFYSSGSLVACDRSRHKLISQGTTESITAQKQKCRSVILSPYPDWGSAHRDHTRLMGNPRRESPEPCTLTGLTVTPQWGRGHICWVARLSCHLTRVVRQPWVRSKEGVGSPSVARGRVESVRSTAEDQLFVLRSICPIRSAPENSDRPCDFDTIPIRGLSWLISVWRVIKFANGLIINELQAIWVRTLPRLHRCHWSYCIVKGVHYHGPVIHYQRCLLSRVSN